MAFYILSELNPTFFTQECQNLVPTFLSRISASILLRGPCILTKLEKPFSAAIPMLIHAVPPASKAHSLPTQNIFFLIDKPQSSLGSLSKHFLRRN